MNYATPQPMTPGAVPPATTTNVVGMQYGRLRQKNPEYALRERWWAELDLLYKGGDDLAQNAERFLPKLVDENDVRYRERLKAAGYINYLAQVVDYFAGALFGQELSITPPVDDTDAETPGETPETPALYKDFERDADQQQTSFAELLKSVVTNALIKRCAWIAIDFPPPVAVPHTSLAEEEATGQTRPYAYEVPCESVLDWKFDKRSGTLDWAILQTVTQERATPEDARGTIVEEFMVWRRDVGAPLTSADGDQHEPVGGTIRWQRYAIAYDPKKPPQPDEIVPLVAEGATSFRRIPLVRFELKPGLWVGNLIGGLVKEHFQRRTTLVSSGNRSLVTIPYVKLSAQSGGFHEPVPADVAQDESRGDDPVQQFKARGYLVLAQGDDVGFAGPDPEPYKFTADDIASLKDETFRVVRQMAASASNSPSVLGRSGESKAQDKASESIILETIGKQVRKTAVTVFTVISEALAENILWTAHGLETFDVTDRAELLEEGLSLDLIPIGSKTFKQTIKTKVALAFVENVDPQTKEQIRQEIVDSVEAEDELRVIEHDTKKDALLNPPPPAPAGAMPAKPGAKPFPPKK